MNRGIEISSEIADSGRSLILDQVTNGVAVRMAVLYLLAGGVSSGEQSADREVGNGTARNGTVKRQRRKRSLREDL